MNRNDEEEEDRGGGGGGGIEKDIEEEMNSTLLNESVVDNNNNNNNNNSTSISTHSPSSFGSMNEDEHNIAMIQSPQLIIINKKNRSNRDILLDLILHLDPRRLESFQMGLIALILSILVTLLVNLIINYEYFLILIHNAINLTMILLCIISLYTWFALIYGKHWPDTTVYIIFLACLISEFIIQLTITTKRAISEEDSGEEQINIDSTSSLWQSSVQNSSLLIINERNLFIAINNMKQAFIIIIVCSITSFYCNLKVILLFIINSILLLKKLNCLLSN
jgi:hypothetical protein